MVFTKSFPKTIEGSSYPRWDEVSLTEAEEKEQEDLCKAENLRLMEECAEDARNLISSTMLTDSDMARVAVSLFEKRASHVVYWKERKAKEKFDAQ